VLPAGHPLAGAGRVRLRQLANEAFVLVRRPGAPGLYADLLTACRAAGFEPAVLQEVPRMTAAINLVAAGTGITVVPASMQRYGQHGVVYLPFARGLRLSAPLHLAYRVHEPNGAAQRFVQLVQAQRAGGKARAGAEK